MWVWPQTRRDLSASLPECWATVNLGHIFFIYSRSGRYRGWCGFFDIVNNVAMALGVQRSLQQDESLEVCVCTVKHTEVLTWRYFGIFCLFLSVLCTLKISLLLCAYRCTWMYTCPQKPEERASDTLERELQQTVVNYRVGVINQIKIKRS